MAQCLTQAAEATGFCLLMDCSVVSELVVEVETCAGSIASEPQAPTVGLPIPGSMIGPDRS